MSDTKFKTRVSKSIKLVGEESFSDLTVGIGFAADGLYKGWVWPNDIGDGWVVLGVETYDGEHWHYDNYRHSWSRSKGKIMIKDDGQKVMAVTRWIPDTLDQED